MALLDPDRGVGSEHARRLARALAAEAEVEVELIAPRQLPDALLRLRKIADRPGRIPGALAALASGDYSIAQAFTAEDAAGALAWGRLKARPVVFSPSEPLSRANVADRRLRLALLRMAVERSAAIVAPDEGTAASLRRWMAVEPRVLPPDAGGAHLALYAELRHR